MMSKDESKSIQESDANEIYILSQLCNGLMLLFFFLSAPQIIITLTGLLFLNPFNEKDVEPEFSSKDLPFVCIRIVTRGTYPNLVQRNVIKNMELIKSCGIKNFVVEVATDKPLYIEKYLKNYYQNYKG